jgi:hypothetical protein
MEVLPIGYYDILTHSVRKMQIEVCAYKHIELSHAGILFGQTQ